MEVVRGAAVWREVVRERVQQGSVGLVRTGGLEAVFNRKLVLDEVSQRPAGDVKGVEPQVVVLLLCGRAEAEGRLPVRR